MEITKITAKTKVTIEIRKLTILVNLGVSEEERRTPQQIEIDVHYTPAKSEAILTDSIADTIDYVDISNIVKSTATQKPFRLIEHLAVSVAESIKQEKTDCMAVKVEVHKLNALPDTQKVIAVCQL